MTRSVEGMSALVTGGGSGIGAAVVARLAAAGARVTVSGRRPDRVRAVADAAGPAVLAVAGDVTDARDRQRMVDAAVEHGDGLELLVHGAANMYRGALEELDEEQLVEVFTSNTTCGNAVARWCSSARCTPNAHSPARRPTPRPRVRWRR